MRIQKKVLTQQTIDIICDICGKSCKSEHGLIFADWGYDSEHDFETWECHLCEKCFFLVVSYVRRSLRGSFHDDNGTIIKGEHAIGHPLGLS
jgi:hypothetical protein